MDGAQFLDGGDMALIFVLFGSVALFLASLLVAAVTSAVAVTEGKSPGLVTRISTVVAALVALVWIAFGIGAALGIDIGLW
jgi:hypothetical protein